MKAYPAVERTARYLGVGAFCALTHNAIMIGGDLAGVHYAPMSLIGVVIMTLLGYGLHATLTFKEKLSLPAFARYSAGVAAGYPLSLLVMAILCSGLGLPVIIAAPISTIVLVVWNCANAHWAILRGSRPL